MEGKDYITKCDCFIFSLRNSGNNKDGLAEATIVRQLGDITYLARYGDIECLATFNPFTGRYYVDDVYSVIKPERKPEREQEYGAR